jgi:hypothetical protein
VYWLAGRDGGNGVTIPLFGEGVIGLVDFWNWEFLQRVTGKG